MSTVKQVKQYIKDSDMSLDELVFDTLDMSYDDLLYELRYRILEKVDAFDVERMEEELK